jgi:hypothetical protein
MQRVLQPPVQPDLRHSEQRDFRPALILAVIAGTILFCGARHITRLETLDGDAAREWQLVKSFANGGLEATKPAAVVDPALFTDPVAAAAALERLAREEAHSPRLRYRVNTGAVDPCPT